MNIIKWTLLSNHQLIVTLSRRIPCPNSYEILIFTEDGVSLGHSCSSLEEALRVSNIDCGSSRLITDSDYIKMFVTNLLNKVEFGAYNLYVLYGFRSEVKEILNKILNWGKNIEMEIVEDFYKPDSDWNIF